jgi:serine/threonine protein phosphatase PrpC
MPEMPLSYAMLSDPGRVRRRNEDACEADLKHGVFVVCDGVGGAAGGEVASQLAAKTLVTEVKAAQEAEAGHKADPDAMLQAGIEAANHAVYTQSQEQAELYGMATTMVALLFDPSRTGESAGTVWLANVGDSRCYRLREGKIEQLTDDHSLVGEQVRSGLITREQAEVSPMRNVITRAIGTESVVQADVHSLTARPGDMFLLASDGLTRDLSDADVAEALITATGPPGGAGEDDLPAVCAELVRRANERGGGDNITCLLVRIR